MASIRVILLTCRRPQLLRRALASLLAQTSTDWVCELHNDAPEDGAPEHILFELAGGDPRFSYHHHIPAWGAVRSFNHYFRGGPEPFVSLLEDDNWWEPGLLDSLLAALRRHSDVKLAWANMKIWRENADGTWTDTGATIWPVDGAPRLFPPFVLLQAFEALHSNGAMLIRQTKGTAPTLPEGTPFAIIESIRERSVEGVFLLLPQVLANFALTKTSARSDDRALWVQCQLLVAASFLEAVPLTPAAWDELWAKCRKSHPRRTGLLLMVAACGVRRAEILSRARPWDFFHFLRSFLGSFSANLRGLRFRTEHKEVWQWLQDESAKRVREATVLGWTSLGAGSPFSKRNSNSKEDTGSKNE
jgi:hypothetical protein